jgi:hypothetical protein
MCSTPLNHTLLFWLQMGSFDVDLLCSLGWSCHTWPFVDVSFGGWLTIWALGCWSGTYACKNLFVLPLLVTCVSPYLGCWLRHYLNCNALLDTWIALFLFLFTCGGTSGICGLWCNNIHEVDAFFLCLQLIMCFIYNVEVSSSAMFFSICFLSCLQGIHQWLKLTNPPQHTSWGQCLLST